MTLTGPYNLFLTNANIIQQSFHILINTFVHTKKP